MISQTTGWTFWAECTELKFCFWRRSSTCDADEELSCSNKTGGAFVQVTSNCNSRPECLKNVNEMFRDWKVTAF